MPPALKRPASAMPPPAKAGKGSKGQGGEGSKGQRGIPDWGAWSQAPGTPDSQDLGESSESEASEKEKEGRHTRSKPQSLRAGYDRDGRPLDEDNLAPYSKEQKRILDRAMLVNPELKQAFHKTSGRVEKRKFVNSLVDPLSPFSARLDPRSCCAFMERTVSRHSTREDTKEQKGVTLTALEADWGEMKVQLGISRGDVIHDPRDGLYYVRTSTKTATVGATDQMDVYGKAALEGAEGARIQDEMADWGAWAKQGQEPGAKGRRSSRASSRGGKVVPADEETMKYLQSAYDKCSAEIKKGKRLGHQLREVTFLQSGVGEN